MLQINSTTRLNNLNELNWTIEVLVERGEEKRQEWEIKGYYRTLGGALERLPHMIMLNDKETRQLKDVTKKIQEMTVELRGVLEQINEAHKQ